MKLWREAKEEAAEEGEDVSQALMELQASYGELALKHRLTVERLDAVEAVYRSLYKRRWLRLLLLPYDPVMNGGRELMRCQTCSQLFWGEGEEEFTTHLGHKYGVATSGSWWDGVRVKMGWVK